MAYDIDFFIPPYTHCTYNITIVSYYDDMWNDAGPLSDDEIEDEVDVDDTDETNTINFGASATSMFRLPVAQFSPLLSLDEENFNTQNLSCPINQMELHERWSRC